MTHEARSLLEEIAVQGSSLATLLEDWRNSDGELLPAKVPLKGESDDLELLACDLDSFAENLLQVVNGITIGRSDASELREFLPWEEDLKSDLDDVCLIGQPGQNFVNQLNELFTLLRRAVDTIGDSIMGRRDFYVYKHNDQHGKVFYIGKGTGKRAWSRNRHSLWQEYVDQMQGNYQVEIIKDGLLEEEAERLEQELIEQHPGELVNWFDAPSMVMDLSNGLSLQGESAYLDALNRFTQSRDETRDIVRRARLIEETDLAAAVTLYQHAVSKVCEYTRAYPIEPGLKGKLMGAWVPLGNDLAALDRLTLILERAGRAEEIIRAVDRFFAEFPSSQRGTVGEKIVKRGERARSGKLRTSRR